MKDEPGMTEKIILIKEQLSAYIEVAGNVSDQVKNSEVSKYPIIVAHKEQIKIGVPIIKNDGSDESWSLNVSSLEEFYTKKLISDNKLEEFRNLYLTHEQDICFFCISELGGQFLFISSK